MIEDLFPRESFPNRERLEAYSLKQKPSVTLYFASIDCSIFSLTDQRLLRREVTAELCSVSRQEIEFLQSLRAASRETCG